MKIENRRYPRSSGMNGDKSGESGAFLFSRRVPDFYDGRRSFPTNENSNFDRRGRRRPSAMVLLITKPLNWWAPVPLSQVNMAENMAENMASLSRSNGYLYLESPAQEAKKTDTAFMDIIKEFPVL